MIEFYNQTLIYNLILSVLILTSYSICLKVVNATEHSLIRMCHVIVTCQIVLEPMVRGSFFFFFFLFCQYYRIIVFIWGEHRKFSPPGWLFSREISSQRKYSTNGDTGKLYRLALEKGKDNVYNLKIFACNGFGCLAPLSTIFHSYIVVVNFIGRAKHQIWGKPPPTTSQCATFSCDVE